MLLGPGEQVLRSAYARLDRGAHDSERRRAGVLYLTNRRLVFEAPRSRGVVRNLVGGRDVDLLIDVRLESVRNATVREGRVAQPRLILDLGAHRAALDVLAPHEWLAALAEARRGEPTRTVAVGLPAAAPGASGDRPRCRYCGGAVREDDRRCPACGAPV